MTIPVGDGGPGEGATDGLVTRQCTGTVADVCARLRAQLDHRGIQIFAVIDHAGSARDAGLDLPDELVVIFGNPAVGTRLMQRNARAGIELPLRMLIWDLDGTTMTAYTPPAVIAQRFSLPADDLPIGALTTLMEQLVETISA